MELIKWMESQGAFTILDYRIQNGRLQARLDGRGWFAPRWADIPEDVVFTTDLVVSIIDSISTQVVDAVKAAYWSKNNESILS